MKKQTGSIGGCNRRIRLINYKSVALYEITEGYGVDIETIEDPVELLCTPRTVEFEEKTGSDELQGGYMSGEITGSLPRLSESMSKQLAALASKRWIVLVEPLTGGCKVFGTPDYPMRFSYSPSVSSDYKTNLYEISLEGDYPEEARFLGSLTRIE